LEKPGKQGIESMIIRACQNLPTLYQRPPQKQFGKNNLSVIKCFRESSARSIQMTNRRAARWLLLISVFLILGPAFAQEGPRSGLQTLLPQMPGWSFAEDPRVYQPGTLFEYIDGAAENYLSYEFKELIVANYKNAQSEATLTLEIYDMGSDINAFGIYSSERYPESRFLALGNQGYIEEGTLNFIVGSLYVKLLCFDCGEKGEAALRSVAKKIEQGVPQKGRLPALLNFFPKDGLVAHSEKFILRNVLGFAFLHDGYLADYKAKDQEFVLFIIEGKDEAEAKTMLGQYLAAQTKNNQEPEKIPLGFQVRDRYAKNVYLAQTGDYILGVMRIEDGSEKIGLSYLEALLNEVKSNPV
jgi:hypothetical protein